MRPGATRVEVAAALAFTLLLVLVSTRFAVAGHQALALHTRDYPFYLQFHAKLFDPERSDRLTLNPRGHNWLGFMGDEGAGSLHRALHFEPVKYLQALVYALSGSVAVSFACVALVFYAPVPYLLLTAPAGAPRDRAFRWIAAAGYALYPSAILSVSYDLRPYALLLPTLALAFLALHHRRPRTEAVLLFNLPFAMREEALILSQVLVFYALAGIHGPHGRYYRGLIGPLLASYAVWLLATLVFLFSSGYGRAADPWLRAALIPGFAAAGTAGVALGWRALQRLRWPQPSETLQAAAFALVFAPLLYEGVGRMNYAPRTMLHVGCIVLALVAAWPLLRTRRLAKPVLAYLALLVLVLAGTGLGPSENSPWSRWKAFRARREQAALVFSLRERLDPLSTVVLADYETYTAFCDFERAYAFTRLPWFMLPGLARFHPENAPVLRRLLRDEADYVVVRQRSLDKLLAEVAASGLGAPLEPVGANRLYAILRVRR